MRARPTPPALAFVLVFVAAASSGLVQACSPNSVCKLGGPINDPSNRTFRRSIMALGLAQFCQQMTTRSAPLRLSPDAPVIGRFYTQRCQQQVADNGDLRVHFDGMGYAFTNVSRKVTFTAGAYIQYDQDFRCADDNSVYAYFDTRQVSPPDFHVLQIELPGASLVQGWITPMADNFGKQMLSGQLAKGFTVIQFADGAQDFDLGHLPLGHRPLHPFSVHGKDRVTVESLRTQVNAGERDFIGPIRVEGNHRAIFTTMTLDGQQSVVVMLIPKPQGDAALQAYLNSGPAAPLPFPPLTTDTVQYGVQYQRAVPVAPGMYYVVIDNTGMANAASAAVVGYSIQIGDAP
ncbi:MAG: hypothetical protein ACRELB_19110 [Polyangiaceae bacterium]